MVLNTDLILLTHVKPQQQKQYQFYNLQLEMDLWRKEAKRDRCHQDILFCLPESTKKRPQVPHKLK